MLGYILMQNPLKTYNVQKTSYPQSELWKYGISGDIPIVLFMMLSASALLHNILSIEEK